MNCRVIIIGGALLALASCATQPTPAPGSTPQRQQQTQQRPPVPPLQDIRGPSTQPQLYRGSDDPMFAAPSYE